MLFSQAGSPLKAHLQLRRWTDLNASDIKIFVVHLYCYGTGLKKQTWQNTGAQTH